MRHHWPVLLLALVTLLLGGGCATYRNVLSPEADSAGSFPLVTEPLRKGDLVELELNDGSQVRGRVHAILPDSISLGAPRKHGDIARPSQGPDQRVALADFHSGTRGGRRFQQPLLLQDASDELGATLRVQIPPQGCVLHWRTPAGAHGSGYLIAAESDTLVLADRRRWLRVHGQRVPVLAEVERADAVSRLAWTDLAELHYWDNHTQSQILIAALVAAGLTAITCAVQLSQTHMY